MTTEEQGPDGRWHPAIPLPFYVRSWRTGFRWRYECFYPLGIATGLCRQRFRTEAAYRAHMREEHLPAR